MAKSKANGVAVDGNSTLTYRRAHPGGGTLGRCSYGIPGVAGIVVFDVALFLPGAPPAMLTLAGVTLAAPTARKVAGVTSAVVATAAQAVARNTGAPLAGPSKVAAAARKAAARTVAATTPAVPATPAVDAPSAPVAASAGTLAASMAAMPLRG